MMQPLSRFLVIFLAPVFASCAIIGCDDPSIAERDAAQAQIDRAAESISLAARRASLDRIAAAEDMRAAGRTASAVLNASPAQQEAASGLVATATTQAALLELARAAQLESANRASRSLALALARIADAMHLLLEAQRESGLDASAEALGQVHTVVQQRSAELASAQSAIEANLAELRAAQESSMTEAQALLLAAEEIRQRGLSAGRGQIMVIAQEAGDKRDEARLFQSQAAQSGIESTAREVELRLAEENAQSASRQSDAIARSIESLRSIQSGFDKTSAQGGEVIANLRETIQSLVTATDSLKHPDLTGCYERALADLESAESSARRSGTSASALTRVLSARARALLARGDGEFQTALLLNSLAGSPSIGSEGSSLASDAQSALAKAQASTKEALEVYSALKESLANGANNTAAVTALAATVDRAVATIVVPSFETPAAAPKGTGSTSKRDASDSDEAPAVSKGIPCATAEDLLDFLAALQADPENAVRIDECLIATKGGGTALGSVLFSSVKAMAKLQLAMKEKFQSTDLGPLAAMAAQQARPTVKDATDESATISLGGPMGSFDLRAVNAQGEWKLDLDATAAEMDPQMRQVLAVVGTKIQPLNDSIAAITAKIESGELTSPEQVQAAMMAAMQTMMQGMGGGPSPEGP